jgi:dTDP-glucose 4,6-dehydratase/UDP-glucuronate decarboxylase
MDSIVAQEMKDIIARLERNNHRFAGKKLLLTGAAGFLGIHFVHYFAQLNDSNILNRPVQLIAVDNFARRKPSWVESFSNRGDMVFMEADITKAVTLDSDLDFILHAASIASPTYYRLHPIETMDSNVTGLRVLLDFAVKHPIESMLFFSSSEVYGDPSPENIPTPETYPGNVSCIGPRACYDESKRFGETLCVNFQRVHGVPVKIVRPFNNYGPGLKITDRRVLCDFFRDILEDRDIVIHSDGTPTRTFCYVSDAIIGYLLALFSSAEGEVFNIGTDKPEISIRELAEFVVRLAGKPLNIVFQPSSDPAYLRDNPKRRCPNINKARTMLGYEPNVGLEKGLYRLYKWYLANPDAPEG